MKYRSAIVLAIGLLWLNTVNQTTAQESTNTPIRQQANEVATLLEGVMDTTAQASTNPKAPRVQMTTCRVQLQSSTNSEFAIFLYQEQALTKELSKPYRQRLLVIAPDVSSAVVQSAALKLATPEQWIGLCNKPESQRVLQQNDLGSPVCTVYLKKLPTGYLGETPPEGCPTNVRGAVRITNTIELNASGMNTWDRGFDANGKQVWGAQSESYQFRRITKEKGS